MSVVETIVTGSISGMSLIAEVLVEMETTAAASLLIEVPAAISEEVAGVMETESLVVIAEGAASDAQLTQLILSIDSSQQASLLVEMDAALSATAMESLPASISATIIEVMLEDVETSGAAIAIISEMAVEASATLLSVVDVEVAAQVFVELDVSVTTAIAEGSATLAVYDTLLASMDATAVAAVEAADVAPEAPAADVTAIVDSLVAIEEVSEQATFILDQSLLEGAITLETIAIEQSTEILAAIVAGDDAATASLLIDGMTTSVAVQVLLEMTVSDMQSITAELSLASLEEIFSAGINPGQQALILLGASEESQVSLITSLDISVSVETLLVLEVTQGASIIDNIVSSGFIQQVKL